MRYLVLALALLAGIPAASAPAVAACDWDRVTADMRWCLVDGRDVKGRGEMINALQKNDGNFMGGVENGFRDCQASGGVRANFSACKSTDQGKLYYIGRNILGLH